MKGVKYYCLMLLTMFPIIAVAFAAQSALNVAQIRNGNASNVELAGGGPGSHDQPPTQKKSA